MHPLNLVHLAFGFAALILGAWVFLQPKGTPRHRTLGRLYFVSMVVLNATALASWVLWGRFGPFHWLSLFSSTNIIAGILPVMRRGSSRNWIYEHALYMSWSYVGLVAAAASQVTGRLSSWPMGITVGLTSAIVVLIGGTLIHSRVYGTIARMLDQSVGT